MKLGLIYCFNRPTKLYYLSGYETITDSEPNLSIRTLTPDFYYSGYPLFTTDFEHLLFLASEEKFHSHTTSFALYTLKNPLTANEKLECITERDLPENEEFCGFYGFHDEYIKGDVVKDTHIYVIQNQCMGKEMVYAIDLDTKERTWLRNPDLETQDSTAIIAVIDEFVFLDYASVTQPHTVYMLDFSKGVEGVKWHKIATLRTDQYESSAAVDIISGVMKSVQISDFR